MRAVISSLLLLASVQAVAQTYEPVLVEPQIAGTPATMTALNLGDDNTAYVTFGFDFPYWDQTFEGAWVSSNGFVSFQSSANLCCNGQPVEQAPRNTIYGFWTDNISYSGNPFYRRSEGSILFGWYGTNEFGTNNQQTFEIDLSSTGSITFNFGQMSNLTYHNAMAGITGPGWSDNIQLFYGRDSSRLSNQSGILGFVAPEPTLDCAVTPLDPACPPQIVAPVQVITSPLVETIHEAYAAEVAADREEIAAREPEPVQETTAVVAVEEVSITEQVAESIAAEIAAPERLSPDQVAALVAPQASVNVLTEVAAPDGFSAVFAVFGPRVDTNTVSSVSTQTASSPVINTVEAVTSAGNPSSVANTLEALNMASPQPMTANAPSEQAQSAMAAGQADTISEMAAVPGFTAYSTVALQDRSDFYAPRDIYRNRRLRDANFEMYRITQTNTSKWQRMVDEQY